MSGLCLATSFLLYGLGWQSFTLAWTHTIEKITWEEDYQVEADGLYLIEARIKGSGAGMEVPEGAKWKGNAWAYQPKLNRFPVLKLAQAPQAGDWQLCHQQQCRNLRDIINRGLIEEPIELRPCSLGFSQ